jgi:hypothetical protein
MHAIHYASQFAAAVLQVLPATTHLTEACEDPDTIHRALSNLTHRNRFQSLDGLAGAIPAAEEDEQWPGVLRVVAYLLRRASLQMCMGLRVNLLKSIIEMGSVQTLDAYLGLHGGARVGDVLLPWCSQRPPILELTRLIAEDGGSDSRGRGIGRRHRARVDVYRAMQQSIRVAVRDFVCYRTEFIKLAHTTLASDRAGASSAGLIPPLRQLVLAYALPIMIWSGEDSLDSVCTVAAVPSHYAPQIIPKTDERGSESLQVEPHQSRVSETELLQTQSDEFTTEQLCDLTMQMSDLDVSTSSSDGDQQADS